MVFLELGSLGIMCIHMGIEGGELGLLSIDMQEERGALCY
jgi:hypothetical protein